MQVLKLPVFAKPALLPTMTLLVPVTLAKPAYVPLYVFAPRPLPGALLKPALKPVKVLKAPLFGTATVLPPANQPRNRLLVLGNGGACVVPVWTPTILFSLMPYHLYVLITPNTSRGSEGFVRPMPMLPVLRF